jgi:signal transduction histidine kinase
VVEILIADRGPGVPPEARRQVFAEFGRAADAEREGQPGLGLGLALSRGLARELGGDLRLVRRLGLGAEFLLELPARMR